MLVPELRRISSDTRRSALVQSQPRKVILFSGCLWSWGSGGGSPIYRIAYGDGSVRWYVSTVWYGMNGGRLGYSLLYVVGS
jgi:hypothetical protein